MGRVGKKMKMKVIRNFLSSLPKGVYDVLVDERIDEIEGHLKLLLQDIGSINFGSSNSVLCQKILYTTFIDALAATRYGKSVGSRMRFTQLISEYSNWSESNNLCPHHLYEFCSLYPELSSVQEYAKKILNDWEATGETLIYLDGSPTLEQVSVLWPNNGEQRVAGKKLEFFSYSNLLYGARSSLVHQNYSPHGLPFFKKEHETPHFVAWKVDDLPDKRLELIFPTLFLHGLCESLLLEVIEYFRKSRIAPWPKGHFSEFMLDGI